MKEKCSVNECEEPVLSKGMCRLHYQRTRRGVKIDRPKVVHHIGCKVVGCSNRHHSKGYCSRHLSRFDRHGNVESSSRHFWEDQVARHLYDFAKRRADKYGVPFSLEKGSIVVPKCCPVLGIPLEPGLGCQQDNSPTLDRFIPEKGYVPGNVVVMSLLANRIKSNATPDQLKRVWEFVEKNERVE